MSTDVCPVRRTIASLHARLARTEPLATRSPAAGGPTLPDGAFREDHRAARLACDRGLAALAAADVDAAERCAVEAIGLEPGWHGGFHLLADALAARGDPVDVERVGLGLLPEETLERLFGPRAGVPARDAEADDGVPERIDCHPSRDHPLPLPVHVRGRPARALDAGSIRARAGWVDRLDRGRVWHDTQNTLVRDAHGREVTEHSKRASGLVARLADAATPVKLSGRLVVIGAPGAGNYFHWLIDILPKLALLEKAGLTRRPDDRYLLPIRRGRFQVESLRRLGIDDDQLIFTKELSPWIEADELLVPYLQNEMGASMGAWLPASLRTLFAADLRGTAADPNARSARSGAGGRLYIGRDPARSQGRGVLNQDEVSAVLAAHDIDTVYPETLTFVEQIRLFADAELIVAPHGAGLANLVFAGPGTAVVECFGAHFKPCYRAIGALAGHRYHALFDDADTAVSAKARQTADMRIDAAALDETLHRTNLTEPPSSDA